MTLLCYNAHWLICSRMHFLFCFVFPRRVHVHPHTLWFLSSLPPGLKGFSKDTKRCRLQPQAFMIKKASWVGLNNLLPLPHPLFLLLLPLLILLLLPRPLLLLLPGVDKTENGKRMEKIKTEKNAQFLKRFYWFYYLCASVSLCTVFIYFLTLRSSLKMITIDQWNGFRS